MRCIRWSRQQWVGSTVIPGCSRQEIANYGVFIPGDDDWNARINDAETTTLAMILSGGLKEFGYVYDFGDSWEHRIIVENVKPTEQQTSYRASSRGAGPSRSARRRPFTRPC